MRNSFTALAMRPCLVFVSIVSLACGTESRQRGSFENVTMVASEELRVGSPDDPEAAFTWFRQLEVGSDGTIFTAHPQERQIRVHDASGVFVRTIGRKGEGPGEFDRIGVMAMSEIHCGCWTTGCTGSPILT